MDIRTLINDEQIPNCTCKYCGYVGKPYQFPFVYQCDNYETKTRLVRVRCPKCDVLDSINE